MYAAGLELPSLPQDVHESCGASAVTVEEWHRVREKATPLPFQYYSEVINPLPVPGEEKPGARDIADDVADIYRDVVHALRLYEDFMEERFWDEA